MSELYCFRLVRLSVHSHERVVVGWSISTVQTCGVKVNLWVATHKSNLSNKLSYLYGLWGYWKAIVRTSLDKMSMMRRSNFFFFRTWSCPPWGSCCISNWRGWWVKQNASKTYTLGSNWRSWGEVKRSNIMTCHLQSKFQRFLYQTLFVFSQIKDIKHINRNFHSVTWVMPQGWDVE